MVIKFIIMNDSIDEENVSFDSSEISEKAKINNDDYALIDSIKNIINSIPYNYLVDKINSKYNEASEKLFEHNNNKPLNISENNNENFSIKNEKYCIMDETGKIISSLWNNNNDEKLLSKNDLYNKTSNTNINSKINKDSAPSALSTNIKKKKTKEYNTPNININKKKEYITSFDDEERNKVKDQNKKNEKKEQNICSLQSCNII